MIIEQENGNLVRMEDYLARKEYERKGSLQQQIAQALSEGRIRDARSLYYSLHPEQWDQDNQHYTSLMSQGKELEAFEWQQQCLGTNCDSL